MGGAAQTTRDRPSCARGGHGVRRLRHRVAGRGHLLPHGFLHGRCRTHRGRRARDLVPAVRHRWLPGRDRADPLGSHDEVATAGYPRDGGSPFAEGPAAPTQPILVRGCGVRGCGVVCCLLLSIRDGVCERLICFVSRVRSYSVSSSVVLRVEFGSLPRRNRSYSVSRSVQTRVEFGLPSVRVWLCGAWCAWWVWLLLVLHMGERDLCGVGAGFCWNEGIFW